MILREKILKIIKKHFQERTGLDYAVDDFEELILKERKEERERIKKIIKDMPDTFPELESDDYDEAYKDAKEYMLIKLKK